MVFNIKFKEKVGLEQGSQTSGPRHHKKLENMPEIRVFCAVKAPSILYWGPSEIYFCLYEALELIFCQNVALEWIWDPLFLKNDQILI